MAPLAVGIDLGTTNSCVAIYKNGKVEVIPTEEDSYVIPSWVSFTEHAIITGHQAKNEAYHNLTNTVFEVKRLMGQRFGNEKVQADIKSFPYQVINDSETPKIVISHGDKRFEYCPEEISAFILEKLKSLAQVYLGHSVSYVVVTVPAYFNDYQRQATKDAAVIAGFEKVNVINEPTAAALAFSHQHSKDLKRNVLVYDFGGGTFDVSIVTVGKGKCEVQATKGDSHLGGTDVNMTLVSFIKDDFKKQFGEDVVEDEATMRRLRSRCEAVKELLSGRHVVVVELDNLSGRDYSVSITREQFDQLNLSLFEKTLEISKTCLENSGLTKEKIDEVVLVGGSSRIPRVQRMLQDYFGEAKINKGVNPDEAVAYGAAIHATNLLGDKSEIVDVLSLSLGIAVLNFAEEGKYLSNTLISSNTSIPTIYTREYRTSYDDQEAVSIIVHQGEERLAADNFELGRFCLTKLKKAPAESTKFDVCFEVDAEGILTVTATEVGADNAESLEIDVKKNGLSPEQIARRVLEMEANRKNQVKKEEFAVAKYNLEKLCHDVSDRAVNVEDDDLRGVMIFRCSEISQWLQNLSISEEGELERKKKELEDMYSFTTNGNNE